METNVKKAGRKPLPKGKKVISKGVYLTEGEWKKVEKKYGSGTIAIRKVILPQC